jgi:hypothetical protein
MIQLQIETLNICDARCLFCEYPQMKRPKGVMPMDLFRKIIDDAAGVPQISSITFTGLGETLLDEHLTDRIRYTRRKLRAIPIDIYTNGSRLTREVVDNLIDAGLSILYCSLNAVDAERRQAIMFPHRPGYDDFERLTGALDYGIERERAGSGMRVVVKAVTAKDLMENSHADTFLARWGGPTNSGGNGFIHLEGNWAGAMWPMRVKPTEACSRALNQIMVLRTGEVSLCCFDGEGKEILGDLNTQTIREVFNGPKATGIREAHWNGRRSDIGLCANCTAI